MYKNKKYLPFNVILGFNNVKANKNTLKHATCCNGKQEMHPDKTTGTLLQKMIQHPRQIIEIQKRYWLTPCAINISTFDIQKQYVPTNYPVFNWQKTGKMIQKIHACMVRHSEKQCTVRVRQKYVVEIYIFFLLV